MKMRFSGDCGEEKVPKRVLLRNSTQPREKLLMSWVEGGQKAERGALSQVLGKP